MARRIIVIEEIAENEPDSIEEALTLLEQQGYKAYLLSTVFNQTDSNLKTDFNTYPQSSLQLPFPSTKKEQDELILQTLLNHKTLLEDELRKYRILLENSDDILYAIDNGGNITFVTSNIQDMLGYKPEEVLGRTVFSFLPVDQHSSEIHDFTVQLSQTGRGCISPNLIKKDGSLLPVEIYARTYYENGLGVLQIGLVRNIAHRKHLEAEMLKQNRELSALYSVASALTSSLKIDTLMDECLQRMMSAMSADSGSIYLLTSDSDFRQGCQRGLDENPDMIDQILRNHYPELQAEMKRGECIVFEDLAQLPHYDQMPLFENGYRSLAVGPLRANNRLLGSFLLLSKKSFTFSTLDTGLLQSMGGQVGLALQTGTLYSELNQTVQELRQTNQRLDEATRHKSEFLANMSHELRTPLNSIIGFSEIIYDQAFGPLNDTQQRFVSNILKSGKHLLALVNDVLDLTKVEAGKMKLNIEELNVHEVIKDSLNSLSNLAYQKHISFSSKFTSTAPTVMADKRKLKQILFNLYSNAIKFTPEGGMVETVTQVNYRLKQGVFEISIRDTGIGIPLEDQERIFEEFQMVDSTLSRKQQGTGLGLALCRKLVQLHGGTLTVRSTLGFGSTFIVTLPINLNFSVTVESERAVEVLKDSSDILQDGVGQRQMNVVSGSEDEDRSAELLEIYLKQWL